MRTLTFCLNFSFGIVIVALSACLGGGLPSAGSDGGNVTGDFAARADLALANDTPPLVCVSTCDRCEGGGCCGSACCNAGEWCDSQQHCRCGMGAGCTTEPICSTGPVSMENQCGTSCCGSSMHPCPL